MYFTADVENAGAVESATFKADNIEHARRVVWNYGWPVTDPEALEEPSDG